MAVKPLATSIQKENFKTKFAAIVKDNEKLSNNYTIQFFDTLTRSNYVINGLDGKSMNVMQHLSIEELDSYKQLKSQWQG